MGDDELRDNVQQRFTRGYEEAQRIYSEWYKKGSEHAKVKLMEAIVHYECEQQKASDEGSGDLVEKLGELIDVLKKARGDIEDVEGGRKSRTNIHPSLNIY
jgi:hypothetical protein